MIAQSPLKMIQDGGPKQCLRQQLNFRKYNPIMSSHVFPRTFAHYISAGKPF